ncbi:diguanylate cyclase [Clostridium rectalis]|uniref:diguanylate cyclase n=1 Tax=Clostridium rectalis TaxID=2040295 RepID=UPI000F63FE88|nr:HD domain-containing phosphohydrolase [Clostridium rectalis]
MAMIAVDSQYKYQAIVENMFDGFAYHKIVLDEDEKPVDYIFLEVNKQFENLTGLKREYVIGKRFTEILLHSKQADFSTIDIYGKIALEGGSAKFDKYSVISNKWFSICAYSYEKNYFATTFIDITDIKKFSNRVAKLSNTVFKYLKFPFGQINYQAICDDMRMISDSKLVTLNLFNKSDNKMCVKAISANGECIKDIQNILECNLLKKCWNIDNITNKILQSKRIIRFNNIDVLLKNKMSSSEISRIRKEMNLGNFYVVPIIQDDILIGDFVIVVSKGKEIFEHNIIEIFANNLSYVLLRIEMEKELKEKEEIWKFAIEANGDGVWNWNIKTNEVAFSKRWKEMLGYNEDEIKDNFETWIKYIHPDDLENVYDSLHKLFSKEIEVYNIEYKLKCKDGSYLNCLARGKIISWDEFGRPYRMIGTHSDITEQKKAYEKVVYLSFHDKLTGLYNRAFFEEELKRLDTERQLPLSIIMGDANGLKLINDAFGHDVGDKLIRKVADILKNCCRKEDIVARVGGDEFVIMLPNVERQKALKIVERIKLNCKMEISDPINPNISLGVATKDNINQDIYKIYKLAEERMYKNKLIESKKLKNEIISSLTEMLRKKDSRIEKHSKNLRRLCLRVGRLLRLNYEQLDKLKLLATLHDIGKIAIPEKILKKEGKLDEIELQIMKKHCEIGYRIASSSPELVPIADSILCHHEYYDGGGYPQGLRGEEIPLYARIISVLDAYDDMTSYRPYRKIRTNKEALEELKKRSGTQFDPVIVDVFSEIMSNKFREDKE